MTRRSEHEQKARADLADCYHIVNQFGWTDLIYTHISSRIHNENGSLLINPYNWLFEQITPDNLVKIDYDGNVKEAEPFAFLNKTGYVIHSAIHRARPDVVCVMHMHTVAGMALSTLECGLLPITQHACRFYNRIGYHDFNGLLCDVKDQDRLVKDLAHHKAMILRNHGLITVGRTIGEAFGLMHFLERAAQSQIQAMSTGAKLIIPPPEVCEKTALQHGDDYRVNGALEWHALVKRLKDSKK